MHYVFVYGSLRYGFELHHLIAKSRYVGLGFVEGYIMYNLGGYPGVVKGDGIVWGEVYEVNSETLRKLDEVEDFEGLEDDLYVRERTRVYFDQKRRFFQDDVNIYRYNQEVRDKELIPEGDYSARMGMPKLVNYFAYAENTNPKVLRERGVNRIEREIRAVLRGYKLIFNVKCRYGLCANLVEQEGEKVCGYLYLMTIEQLNHLDKHERHLLRYMREVVPVEDDLGNKYFAIVYMVNDSSPVGEPGDEYRRIMEEGIMRMWGEECLPWRRRGIG